jgi:hypothetical protein
MAIMNRAAPDSWLRARHTGAVLALVAAPLAGTAWSFLVPLFTGSMATEVANIAANPSRFVAGTYLGVLMSFLMIPAAIATARLLRPYAPVATDVAMVLTALGACFHGGVLVFQLTEVAVIAAVPDQAQATTIVSRIYEHPAFTLILAPFLAFYVGLAAFSAIMLVRRAVPMWIPILILVSIPIELAGPMLWKARLFFVMLTVAFAALALLVLRIGPAEWARRTNVSGDSLEGPATPSSVLA